MAEPESTRKADLGQLRDDLQARMAAAASDQNFAVMGRLLVDVLKQLDEVAAPATPEPEKGSVLSEFEAKLAARESKSAAARRTKV